MPILKTKNRKNPDKEKRHVGVLMPTRVSSFLTLYTAANCVSKSSILLKLIRQWMLSLQEDDITEDSLIEEVSKQVLTNWKQIRKGNPHASLREFKEQLIFELEWKGLPKEVIRRILIGFNNGTK